MLFLFHFVKTQVPPGPEYSTVWRFPETVKYQVVTDTGMFEFFLGNEAFFKRSLPCDFVGINILVGGEVIKSGDVFRPIGGIASKEQVSIYRNGRLRVRYAPFDEYSGQSRNLIKFRLTELYEIVITNSVKQLEARELSAAGRSRMALSVAKSVDIPDTVMGPNWFAYNRHQMSGVQLFDGKYLEIGEIFPRKILKIKINSKLIRNNLINTIFNFSNFPHGDWDKFFSLWTRSPGTGDHSDEVVTGPVSRVFDLIGGIQGSVEFSILTDGSLQVTCSRAAGWFWVQFTVGHRDPDYAASPDGGFRRRKILWENILSFCGSLEEAENRLVDNTLNPEIVI